MRPEKAPYFFLLLLLTAILILTSCSNRPKEVLNKKKMEQVMYDVYVAESIMENDYQNFSSYEEKEAYINRVIAANNVTQAQWDTSLSWYSDRIDIYLKMNDSVKARLKRSQQEVDALVANENAQRMRSNDVIFLASYIPPVYSFLTPGAQKGGFRFSIDSAEIGYQIAGNKFAFNYSVIGIPPSFDLDFTSLLILDYSDTIIYRHQEISENRTYNIPLFKYLDNDTLSRISGYVHLQSQYDIIPDIRMYDIYLDTHQIDE